MKRSFFRFNIFKVMHKCYCFKACRLTVDCWQRCLCVFYGFLKPEISSTKFSDFQRVIPCVSLEELNEWIHSGDTGWQRVHSTLSLWSLLFCCVIILFCVHVTLKCGWLIVMSRDKGRIWKKLIIAAYTHSFLWICLCRGGRRLTNSIYVFWR
jgi:hypothetical protein